MQDKVVGRFAPSPSGRMHLGNIYTALLAWLSARSAGGRFLLRIEDLDPQRSRAAYADDIRSDLAWLGLTWDEEMPLQSSRADAYARCFDRLDTYPCYCSRQELLCASAPHGQDGARVYAGTCRGLTPQQRGRFRRAPSWRVRVPDQIVCFTDGVFGLQRQALGEQCGDFIVRRADGVYAYQLAVVCDDAAGGVTQVVRGCDLLFSTPRQIWLYETLGFRVPAFYHVPLLVAPDGKRLSKREKSLDMGALRLRYTPQALLGKVANAARLTPSPAPISAEELLPAFSWDRIGRQNVTIPEDF